MHIRTQVMRWICGLACMLAGASPALAQANAPLAIALSLFKVEQTADGRERLSAAPTVRPGDVVEFQALYENRSRQTLARVVPTLPMPAGVGYLPLSAHPLAAQASLDGQTFAPEPLMRPRQDAAGALVQEPVPASEYRALRWSARSLAAGQRFVVKARARVTSAEFPSPAPVASATR